MCDQSKIGKKIYFYWGNEKMSWMRYMTLYSFRKFNPDWEMFLWSSPQSMKEKPWITPNDQDFFCYTGEDYSERIKELNIEILSYNHHQNKSPSHTSNFFKWGLLCLNDGLYADMDILWFKPINKFYEKIKNFDTVICQTDYVSIGLLASSGNNKFFGDLYANAKKHFHSHNYQTAGVDNIYNYFRCETKNVLEKARSHYPDLSFHNIPMNLIYAYDSTQVEDAFAGKFSVFPPEAIGYHWYAGHPVAQVFNNKLNENTYKEDNSLFSQIVRSYEDKV